MGITYDPTKPASLLIASMASPRTSRTISPAGCTLFTSPTPVPLFRVSQFLKAVSITRCNVRPSGDYVGGFLGPILVRNVLPTLLERCTGDELLVDGGDDGPAVV